MKKYTIRLVAIFRILTSKNWMLIDGIKEYKKDGEPARCSRLLRRTDYDTESDFLTLKGVLFNNFDVVEIEQKHHSETTNPPTNRR